MDLSIVVPIYNEEGNLPTLYERLKKTAESVSPNHEIIFVHDGGKDGSVAIIKHLAAIDSNVKYIDFSRNFGHQIAISAGMDKATGKAVAIIDGDLQDPPELIRELYHKLQEGYEVVYAKRKKRDGESWFKLITAKWFYRILSRITSVNIPVDTGDFRIVDHKIIRILKQMPEKNKFIRGQIAWIGFRQTYLEYDRDERLHGETKYTIRKMLRLALDGITSFSTFPLKVATFSGFLVSGIAFVVILYALYSKFFLGQDQVASGWASIMISVLFIGGVQLIGIGIIGEYIGRVSDNVKNRPLYIVKETNIEEES